MSKLPIFIALDLNDEKTALDYAEKLSPYVMGFKVGPRLYFRSSSSLIKKLSSYGKVFLDFKFYDIPSTMEASIKACFDKGVHYATVHAQAGQAALSKLAELEKSYKGQKVLAVTILTSEAQTGGEVLKLAKLVYESGLSGLVSSAYEVKELRNKYKDFFLVTPGIRLSKSSPNNEDQRRIASPAFALKEGASALVMGRPILQSENPIKTLQDISQSLKK